MKKSLLLFIIFNMLFGLLLNSAKSFVFSDVYRPLQIAVDKNHLYISDQYGVKVYSLNNFEFIRKIGKKGEGPGEFDFHPNFQIISDSQEILLYWRLKAVLFNKNGNILYEKRFPNLIRKLYKVSSNYIMNNMSASSMKLKYEYIIFNENFNKISTIEKKTTSFKIKTTGKFVITLPSKENLFKCYSDKIFLSNMRNDFYIEVYDHMGKKIKHIEKEYKNIKINKKQKEKIKNDYFDQPAFKQSNKWKGKIEIVFKEFYPAIKDFFIADKKIYVETYLSRNGKNEFIILNFDGKITNKVFLHTYSTSYYSLGSRLYTIKNNKYYYLKENEDTENYELFCEKIEKGE